MKMIDIIIIIIAVFGVFIIPALIFISSRNLPPPTIDPKPIKPEKTIKISTRKRFTMPKIKTLSQSQKTFTIFSILSIILLILVITDCYDFDYTFLRIIISISMIGFLLEKFPIWYKFVLGLNLILYNPLAQIHLGSKSDWELFNWLTLILIILSLIIIFVRLIKTFNHDVSEKFE